MPVPTAITDLSTSAAGNSPAGSDTVFPNLDDYIRALSAFIAQNYASLATKQASLGYTPVNKAGDTLTGVLAATKGTAALPGIAFSGDTNTGIHSSGADILDLVTAGAAQWRVDASGRLVAPARKQPCFRAATSANKTGTGDFATFTSEVDDASNFDPTTGVFTAPVAGWYEFTALFVASISTGDGETICAIKTNTPTYFHASVSHQDASTARYATSATGPIYLASGATVQTTCTYADGTYNMIACASFSGRLLG